MDLVKELKLEMEKASKRVKSLAAAIAALGGETEISSNHKTGRRKKMSAAGRARISAAQKARWAKVRAGKKVK